MQSEIKKWGNSAAVRLPARVLAAAGLETGVAINITTENNKVVIEAIANIPRKKLKLPFTEEQLLTDLNAHTAHADELAELSPAEIRS